MPDIWEASLANDVRLLGIENSETPLVTFNVTTLGGTWLDPDGKAGRASLLAGLMNEGAATKTPAELGQAIGLLGSGGSAPQPLRIRTSVRANATGASLDVIQDMVENYGPDFDAQDRKTTQQKIIKDNTRAFESLRAKLGTLQSISKYERSKRYLEDEQDALVEMSVADFQNIAAKYLDESDMIYVVVGDKATKFEPVKAFAKKHNKGDVVELDIYGAPL